MEAFQTWGGVSADGILGDQTWSVWLHAASATLEPRLVSSTSSADTPIEQSLVTKQREVGQRAHPFEG